MDREFFHKFIQKRAKKLLSNSSKHLLDAIALALSPKSSRSMHVCLTGKSFHMNNWKYLFTRPPKKCLWNNKQCKKI